MTRKMSTAPLTNFNETKTSQPKNRPRGPTPKDAHGFQKVWDGYKWIERVTVNIHSFIHSNKPDTPLLPADQSPPPSSPLSPGEVQDTVAESETTSVSTEKSDNESEWEEEIGPCEQPARRCHTSRRAALHCTARPRAHLTLLHLHLCRACLLADSAR